MTVLVSKSMSLGEKQRIHTLMVAELILFARDRNCQLSWGDAYRDPRVFGAIGERKGYGESRSAHKQRLAVDLNLFKNGVYQQETEAHAELGAFWESMGGKWGGRFNDGNHYSIEHNGIA